jgi:hypothetical protein
VINYVCESHRREVDSTAKLGVGTSSRWYIDDASIRMVHIISKGPKLQKHLAAYICLVSLKGYNCHQAKDNQIRLNIAPGRRAMVENKHVQSI